MKCPWKANTIWRRFAYYRLSCYFLYYRDWCLTPPDKKKHRYIRHLSRPWSQSNAFFFFLKIEKVAFQIAAENCCPGDDAGNRREITKNNKAQWVPRLFLDVPLLLQYITWRHVNRPLQSPKTKFWMALTRIFQQPQKMVCYIWKWDLH